jgi:hypothetical protein
MAAPSSIETNIELLGRVAYIATTLQQDVLAFSLEASSQVARFKAGETSLEDVCFWHKSLAGAFFASADGLCLVLREAVIENAYRLDLTHKLHRLLAPESRVELEKLAPDHASPVRSTLRRGNSR